MKFLHGLILTGVIANVMLDCEPFRKRKVRGKDLLRAKTHFGIAMRECKREIDQLIRVVPVKDYQKRVIFYCDEFLKCRSLASTVQGLIDCMMNEITNTSSPVFVEFHEVPEVLQVGKDLGACGSRLLSADESFTLEDFDNAAAVFYGFLIKLV